LCRIPIRLNDQEEAGFFRLFQRTFPKQQAQVGVVGRFVCSETHVTVDAQDRAAGFGKRIVFDARQDGF
jgi:hypothetical protein